MIRRLSSLFALFALALAGAAQSYVVSGTAENARTGSAVEFASAVLMRADSTGVVSSLTDENGSFVLCTKTPGRYIVKLSYVGFSPLFRNVELTEKADSIALGPLKMESAEKVLGTAVVSTAAARVEQKEDTTVFNASAYRVPEGSTLEALVKQLPGVEVSDEGKIKWNGKEVKEMLVNGKDFFKGDTKVAMKNLPTELVSKIKAYDKVSDYTEQTGIDDGEETTVLDIATKRQLNESWITNIDVGYGTHDRYTGKFFASRFTDNSRITAFGSANNVNDRGFGGPRGMGGGGGLTATKEAGIDFSWENGRTKQEGGKFEIGGNVRYGHTGTDAVTRSSNQTFLSAASRPSYSLSNSIKGSSSNSVNANLRLKWNPDSLTNISFRPTFSHSDNQGDGSSRSATFNADPDSLSGFASPLDSMFLATVDPTLAAIAVNSNKRLSLSDGKSNSVSGDISMMRRLGSNGRNLSVRLSANYSSSKSHSYSISDIRYFATTGKGSYLNQYSNMPSKNWSYSARLGYVEPLGGKWYGEVRYEYAQKYKDADRSRYNLNNILDYTLADGTSFADSLNYPAIGTLPTLDEVLNAVRDNYNSQYATYKYYDHTANVGVRYNTQTIRFNAGVSFNPEKTRMAYQRPGQNVDTLITRHVFNVSPEIRFRYRFSKTTNLDIRYRGSSSQPSMTDLLAVVDNADPLNISMGNPGLKPSWTNNLSAFFNTYDATAQRGIMGSLNFSQTRNSISNRMVYDETTGVRFTRPENISGNWNARGSFMFNSALGAQKLFNISTFTNLSYQNAVGYISSTDRTLSNFQASDYADYDDLFRSVSHQKNATRTLGIGENLNASYRASIFDIGINGSVNYQHARATLQKNANMDTWNFSYGANANLTLDCGFSLSTDIRMSSRRGYSSSSMNTNELLWNAQISQSFLKGRPATISLQFYDILHKQSNVSRTLTATMRSDSWNNAINSYIMVHFIYRLNIFPGGKKNADKKDDDRPDGPGRGDRMGPPPGGNGGGRPMGPPPGGGGGRF